MKVYSFMRFAYYWRHGLIWAVNDADYLTGEGNGDFEGEVA